MKEGSIVVNTANFSKRRKVNQSKLLTVTLLRYSAQCMHGMGVVGVVHLILPLVRTTTREGLLTENLISPLFLAAQSLHGVDMNICSLLDKITAHRKTMQRPVPIAKCVDVKQKNKKGTEKYAII